MMAPKSKRLLLVTVSLSLAVLAPINTAAAQDDVPIARVARPASPGGALARMLPRLEPFEPDEITVYAERLATLSPASRVSIVALADEKPRTTFTVRAEPMLRLSIPVEQAPASIGFDGGDHARVEGEVALAAATSPGGLDVGFAQRTSLESSASGERVARGAEVRIGRRLRGVVAEFEQPTWDRPSWYFFAASDGQALTWTPATANGARDVRLQDRVTIGDMQAGITIQASGLQASLTYLEREVSNAQRTDKQSFAGLAITLRR